MLFNSLTKMFTVAVLRIPQNNQRHICRDKEKDVVAKCLRTQ